MDGFKYNGKAICERCKQIIMLVNNRVIWHVGSDDRKCAGSGKELKHA